MTESEMIKGCLRFNRHAQSVLFNTYSPLLMGISVRYSKSTDEAKAILAETFVNVFEKIRKYKSEESLNDWLRKKTIETAVAFQKRNKAEYRIMDTVNAAKIEEQQGLLSEDAFAFVNEEEYIRALNELTPACRNVFNLAYIDEYSTAEISAVLEVGEETVKQNLEKARFNFRKNLSQLIPNRV